MDWKLLGSTFALIFLAELGDKTQLAAFAATAGSRSPWSIFVGASCALVLSTLLAVLFGEAIQRVVPAHWLKIGAGVLFLVFGGVLLASGLRPRAAAATPAAARPGVLARLALDTAAQFERAAAQDYRSMAAATRNTGLRDLLTWLAAEEEGHLAAVVSHASAHGDTALQADGVRPVAAMNPPVERIDESTMAALALATRHEEATAGFYEELARAAPLPELRNAFAGLAAQEREHARRLGSFGCPA